MTTRKRKETIGNFLARVERAQRIRVQRLLFEVTRENRALGGKKWRKVWKAFALTDKDL